MGEKPKLDNALIDECQREQQAALSYSDAREEVARKIAQLIEQHPEFRRDQIVDHIGKMGTSKNPS